MKRILAVALVVVMAAAAFAVAQQTKDEATKQATPPKQETQQSTKPEAAKVEAKPMTFTGEVIDLYCFMDHAATGPDHAKCASSCIKKGLPVGFKTADGAVYLITGKEHEPINATVADFAGKKSTITGVVKEQGGIKAIELVSIAEAK